MFTDNNYWATPPRNDSAWTGVVETVFQLSPGFLFQLSPSTYFMLLVLYILHKGTMSIEFIWDLKVDKQRYLPCKHIRKLAVLKEILKNIFNNKKLLKVSKFKLFRISHRCFMPLTSNFTWMEIRWWHI